MKVLEALQEAMDRSGINRNQLANALCVNRATVTISMKQRRMSASRVAKWCEVLGYKVVLVPSQQVRFLSDQCIAVDPYDEEDGDD